MPAPATIPDSTDAEMRRAVLVELMHRLGGDAASSSRMVVDRGRLTVLGVVGIGPPSFLEPRLADQGRPIDNVGALDVLWKFNEFIPEDAERFPPSLRDRYWTQSGMRSALAMNVGRRGQYVGYVCILRSRALPPFGPDDLAKARALSSWTVDTLERAARVDETGDLCAGSYVFAADGGLRFATIVPIPSCAPELLGRCVREFVRGERWSESLLGRWRLSMSRLSGGDGDAVVVEVRRVWSGQMPKAMRMSAIKRQIAALAARGATVPEIAASLGRKGDTVRAHLKEIYDILEVNSRVELAEACRLLWSGHPGDEDG